MDLSASTVLVTGANRGFGRALAAELLARGATVYAGARNPDQVDLPGAEPIALDVTDPASATAAAEATGDVTVLVSNAGPSTGADLLAAGPDDIRLEMDTRFFGTLCVIRAFAPQIAAGGGGAILNALSDLSWVSFPEPGAHCAAKSAEWSLPNALRVQLADQNIRVAGLHVGYMDTDMVRDVDAAKSGPADIARIAVDGIAAGAYEILADSAARQAQAALSQGVLALYPQLPRPHGSPRRAGGCR
ncbi:SDR family oxidoreductase [Streptomyces scabiei]|uniref:SDR family oxidoreductase n=1 Tax=Streptomyces scabiei TaxID=1930 RepID=UPI00298FE55B|nr:SDR family oxidoreductase [Streptomyces scabiei]MDW8803312.1 SDR family oxidoreductase [Streptomyces scabiei]